MELKRTNIYDFSVGLDEAEFEQLKCIAERADIDLEEAFSKTLAAGLDIIQKDGL